MKRDIRPLVLFLVAFASLVRAGEFKIGGIAIDVPVRFDGPAAAHADVNARAFVFTVRASSPLSPSTILQVTEIGPEANTQAGRSGLAERYLLRMLEGVERRRTDFQKSAPKEIRMAGFPGSAVSWQGKANGIGTNGKMYCIVTKSELVFFHVMGGGSAPNVDMAAAIKAVENARKY